MRPHALVVAILTLGILAAPLPAETQPRVARVGILSIASAPSPYVEALREGLRELGYVEGRNLTTEVRFAGTGGKPLAEHAAELVGLKVDVIVAVGGGAAVEAAKRVTTTTPIVMGASPDPVEAGFVSSLARPGGNVTGMSWLSSELSGKRLELLREIVPAVTRVGVLSNPSHPGEQLDRRELRLAAERLGIWLQYLPVKGSADFEHAFAALLRERAEAIVPVPDAVTLFQRNQLAEFALKHRLPTIASWREFTEAGCLMSYGPNLREGYKRLAGYVDRILKGAKPADLPVEQPMKFELVINLKTAKALSLTIPQSVLIRADQVIE